MARFRSGNAIQSKIQMILFGNPFTGKSTMALQSAYLKNPDGSPFKVLYLDPESGSVDDYLPTLAENGVDMRNILIAYTQSITEVLEFIERAKNGEDFYIPDDDGNETDEVYLDSDGKPFRPDMIVVDGASVLNLTTKTSIVEFSKKRAKVKAAAAGLTGDEKFVKIEGAGMELKDYQTVNFKGQELILDLMGTGKHYIVTARETDEKITKEINGKEVTVATGRKIPDGFKNMDYNAKTCIRMYRDEDDYTTVRAFVVKDRTGIHKAGDDIEDPSLLDYQDLIDKTSGNREFVIKNTIHEAIKTEERKYAEEIGVEQSENENEPEENTNEAEVLRDKITGMINSLSPVLKQKAKKAVADAGLPTAMRTVSDVKVLHQILKVVQDIG